ncbi:MAG: BMP family ABC transporter substrate-binding protein [Chloroflexota bacterium]
MKRTIYLLLSVMLLTLFLTACGGAEEEDEFSFALVLPGQLGDRSFADSSNRGAERAIEELGVQGTIIETTGISEHEAAMRGAIQAGNDIVLPLALDAQLLLDLAAEFPDQKFGAPSDVFADELPDNLAAFQINVHESSFLVGLIAGSMTETKVVGAVVGGDAPSLNQFFYGYKQGVLEACPDCEVLVGYLGFDFNNPTLGLETALGQYEQGADIVYQAWSFLVKACWKPPSRRGQLCHRCGLQPGLDSARFRDRVYAQAGRRDHLHPDRMGQE